MIEGKEDSRNRSKFAATAMARRQFHRRLIRFTFATAQVLVLPCMLCASMAAQQMQQPPAPIERRPPSSSSQSAGTLHRGPRGEHLAEWMTQHSNLSPQQQREALEREPGFQQLPPQTQQRMRDRLAQLDAMDPQHRQRLLARNEAMERLNPDQRAQVRGAMSQLGTLPLDERRAVAHTFHELTQLPPNQRMSALDSGRYGPPLNEAQRSALLNLLRAEPLLGPMLMPHGHTQNDAPMQTLR